MFFVFSLTLVEHHCQRALSQIGVFLQVKHDPKMGVFPNLDLTYCYFTVWLLNKPID